MSVQRRHAGPITGAALAAALRLVMAALLASATLAGCATPNRLPAVPSALVARAEVGPDDLRYRVARDTTGLAGTAREALRRELAWRAAHGETGPLPPVNLL